MTIAVGEKLPEASFISMGEGVPEEVSLASLTADRTIVIFGVPGAYTPTCSVAHVPSFMRTKDQFAAKGVAEIACVSVNDPFVMKAWGEATGATEAGITMLADPSGAFIKAIGLDFDAPPVGLLSRAKRFAMVVKDGEVAVLNIEASPGECEISAGEALLQAV